MTLLLNFRFFNKAEFTTTVSELNAIAAAAITGLSKPKAAKGIAAAL